MAMTTVTERAYVDIMKEVRANGHEVFFLYDALKNSTITIYHFSDFENALPPKGRKPGEFFIVAATLGGSKKDPDFVPDFNWVYGDMWEYLTHQVGA